MKILLINPSHTHLFSRGQPSYYFEEQGLFPPLGLLSIAAYLLEYTNHDVQALDMQVSNIDQKRLQRYLRNTGPDIVGISCLTNMFFDVLKVARSIKTILPSAPVILGGYHTSLYPFETLAQPDVDAIVIGSGEVAFTNLVEEFDMTGEIRRIPGVLRPGDNTTDTRREFQINENLDALPFPARHLTPYKKYNYPISAAPPVTVLMTSMGCSYNCIFCNTSRRHKDIIFKSPKRVVDEMEDCINLGIGEFLIQDENFAFSRDRVIGIADEILRRRLRIVWNFKSRVDHIDRDLIRIVRRAGCNYIHFGVESGDPGILKLINKGITLDQTRDVFKMVKEEGLDATAAFMIGLPGENLGHIQRTIDFAVELELDYVQFAIAIPLPETRMYQMAFDKGFFTRDYWQEFAQNPFIGFNPPGWHENFTQERLEELLDYAYRSFYLRPKYIFRRIKNINNFSKFIKHVRIGTKILINSLLPKIVF